MRAALLLTIAVAALTQLPQPAQQQQLQLCPPGRSLSASHFGFLKAPAQGTNDSYAYVVFLLDAGTQLAAAGTGLGCSGSGRAASERLLAAQRLEAALWAVSSFHSRYAGLLPGVSVGALLLDSCSSRLLTVQQVGNLQLCEVTFGQPGSVVEPRSTIGTVGPDSAEAAGAALPLLQSAGKATVSYQLADPQFASRSAWPLLARVSPDSLADVEALAQSLRAAGGGHAQIVRGAAQRHSAMAQALAGRLRQLGVCVAANLQLTGSSLEAVNSLATVRPVFLLLDAAELRDFAEQMLRLRPGSGAFTWLLPSELDAAVGDLLPGREAFFAGSLLLRQFASARGFSDFQASFKALRPDSAGRNQLNPWFASFWAQQFSCNLPGAGGGAYNRTCNFADAGQNLQSVSSFPASTARVIQATDLLLHSLEAARRTLCGTGSSGLCSAFRADASRFRLVYDGLFSVRSSLGYSDVELNSATAGPLTFSLQLLNLQRAASGSFSWVTIGSFQTNSLLVSSTPQAYGPAGGNATWSSLCSEAACQAACPAASTTTSPTPMPTSTTTMPSSTFNTSGMEQLRFRRQYWVYALIVCASVGLLATLLFITYILIIVLDLPSELKTFNTLWSGQFLLLVILFGYITLFAWVPWPTRDLCGIIRFMVGFEYAAIFSILLVKLLNLMNENLKPVFQVLLFFFCLAVQVATSVEWLLLVPSEVTMVTQRCNHTFIAHLQTLVYCMLLILLCVLLAVRAHSIGKNNREVIFIGCAAGLSIPIWLAWTLVGSLNNSLDFGDASMAFGLFVNLTVILLLLFIPKVYQLRRIREEEEEQTSMPDLSDFDDEEERDSIYVMTKPAASIAGDIPNSPNIYGLQQLPLGSTTAPATRSLAGDYSTRLDPRILSYAGQRRSYSDYEFPAHSPAANGKMSLRSQNPETKSEKMTKLEYL